MLYLNIFKNKTNWNSESNGIKGYWLSTHSLLTLICFKNLFNSHLVIKLHTVSVFVFCPLCVLLKHTCQEAHSLCFREKTKEGTDGISQTVYTPTPLCASYEDGLN